MFPLIINKISTLDLSGKFNKRSNNNQVDFMETERIVIADLLSWSDLKKCIYTMLFKLMMIKFHGDYLKTFTIHEVA